MGKLDLGIEFRAKKKPRLTHLVELKICISDHIGLDVMAKGCQQGVIKVRKQRN